MDKTSFFLRSVTPDGTFEEFKTLLQYSSHTLVCTLTITFNMVSIFFFNTCKRIPKALILLKTQKPRRRDACYMQTVAVLEPAQLNQ